MFWPGMDAKWWRKWPQEQSIMKIIARCVALAISYIHAMIKKKLHISSPNMLSDAIIKSHVDDIRRCAMRPKQHWIISPLSLVVLKKRHSVSLTLDCPWKSLYGHATDSALHSLSLCVSVCVCGLSSLSSRSDLSPCINEVKSYSNQGKCDVQAETYSASLDDHFCCNNYS